MAATVWVVDDDESVLEVLGGMIQELGYKSRLFTQGRQALDAYQRGKADILIVDVRMPDMSGLDLTRALLKKDPYAVVVILTGFPSISDAVEAIRTGAMDYLTKPFRMEEIRVRIERALESRELQDRLRKNRLLTWVLIGSLPLWFILGIILVRSVR